MPNQVAILLLCFLLGAACKPQIPPIIPAGAETTGHILILSSYPAADESGISIYAAGTFNNWNPGDENFRLRRNAQGLMSLQFPDSLTATIELKFTRGNWATVEVGQQGSDVANRKIELSPGDTTLMRILAWKDDFNAPPVVSTAASNVKRWEQAIVMDQLDRERHMWVYLPPGYHQNNRSYAVWYMHDGQNLFDQTTAFSGEWQVDESLNSLLADSLMEGVIVVALENGGEHRIAEYSPWPNAQYGGGEGDGYLSFIIDNLKPGIDSLYRTKPEAAHTGIMGSSLGALISLYGGLKYPQVFGKVGLFSPALWFNREEIFNYARQTYVPSPNQRFYFLASHNESESMVPLMVQMADIIATSGPESPQVLVKPTTYGGHNENFWAGEFKEAILWLDR